MIIQSLKIAYNVALELEKQLKGKYSNQILIESY